MLRALTRFFRRSRPADPAQLGLELASGPPRPRTAGELLTCLQTLGLRGFDRCRLTRNRTVMVSFRGGELRLHEAFLAAPNDVLAAIVDFACGRTRAQRARARRAILAYPIERPPPARRSRERPHPADDPLVRELRRLHAEFNRAHFGGQLAPVTIRVSRRMKTRLGHYSAPLGDERAEIVISRRHIRRHGWRDAGRRSSTRWSISGRTSTAIRSTTDRPSGRGPARSAITPSARRLLAARARPSETDVMETDVVGSAASPAMRLARDG